MTEMNIETKTQTSTPLEVIAVVSRVVTKIVDRITGDRSDFPLLVCLATQHALRKYKIDSTVMFGAAAWVEVCEDSAVLWAGCWGESHSFWLHTQYQEVVDLNTSVGHRKRFHSDPSLKPKYSPPILWSAEVPAFYRYEAEGIAEIELTEPKDKEWMTKVLIEIDEKCVPEKLETADASQFPNEPVICPGRKLLDDSVQSFQHFDRALAVVGIPEAPF